VHRSGRQAHQSDRKQTGGEVAGLKLNVENFHSLLSTVMLVLRTFPELVGRSVQNLVEIGLVVRA